MLRPICFLFMLLPALLSGQKWVDTVYTIQSSFDVSYGTAIDFAGTERNLELDISWPTNDTVPACGRPLLVMVHGGAWIGGSKADGIPARIRKDFAKRGYVTASVNYRLGLFHTNRSINCNIPDWNCFNMTDSSEWYRANYRAIQDVHGAIRYLINRSAQYDIDPEQVFLIGESAGGFVAMGVGFIDDSTEVLQTLVDSMPDAPAPNQLYENNCIKAYGLAVDIDSMDLRRPALGPFTGTLNLPLTQPYTIRGVGNIYGGAFNNYFASPDSNAPVLYFFHRPCDLIVPYNKSRLLAGLVTCAQGFPTFCGNIINRSRAYGSKGIKDLIDTLNARGQYAPRYEFDASSDQFNCLQQVSSPCHAIDNFWLRTNNIASFFKEEIKPCINTSISNEHLKDEPVLSPNPCHTSFRLIVPEQTGTADLIVTDMLGKKYFSMPLQRNKDYEVDVSKWAAGSYYVYVISGQKRWSRLLIVSQ